MIIKRIDSATVIVDNVMFSRSESNGLYLSFSPECTEKHIEQLNEFLKDEYEEKHMPTHVESLNGIYVCLN